MFSMPTSITVMRSGFLRERSSGRDLEGIFKVEREKVSTRLPTSIAHDSRAFQEAVADEGYQRVLEPLLCEISAHKLKLYIVACEFSKTVRKKLCEVPEEQHALREILLPICIPHLTLLKYVSIIKRHHSNHSKTLDAAVQKALKGERDEELEKAIIKRSDGYKEWGIYTQTLSPARQWSVWLLGPVLCASNFIGKENHAAWEYLYSSRLQEMETFLKRFAVCGPTSGDGGQHDGASHPPELAGDSNDPGSTPLFNNHAQRDHEGHRHDHFGVLQLDERHRRKRQRSSGDVDVVLRSADHPPEPTSDPAGMRDAFDVGPSAPRSHTTAVSHGSRSGPIGCDTDDHSSVGQHAASYQHPDDPDDPPPGYGTVRWPILRAAAPVLGSFALDSFEASHARSEERARPRSLPTTSEHIYLFAPVQDTSLPYKLRICISANVGKQILQIKDSEKVLWLQDKFGTLFEAAELGNDAVQVIAHENNIDMLLEVQLASTERSLAMMDKVFLPTART